MDPNVFQIQDDIEIQAPASNWRVYPVIPVTTKVAFIMAGNHLSGKFFHFTGDSVYYGASQASLIYQNSRFRFNYLHSPFYTDGHGTVGASIEFQGNNVSTVVTQASGIAFTTLEPASFWEDLLGFDLDQITRPVATYKQSQPQPFQQGTTITGALVGNSTLLDQSLVNQMKAVTGQVKYSQTSQTDGLIAVNANRRTTDKDKGFYFIDINGIESNRLSFDSGTSLNIAGMVSRNYNSDNGIITGYAESGSEKFVDYPITLNKFTVRILKVNDKTEAESLGPNSCVFLQIDCPSEK